MIVNIFGGSARSAAGWGHRYVAFFFYEPSSLERFLLFFINPTGGAIFSADPASQSFVATPHHLLQHPLQLIRLPDQL
jgi:hypothetical protein